MQGKFFITGIGTGIGKTLASAVLCKALGAEYWKPIQTGARTDSDSRTVAKLTGDETIIHPEAYRFSEPLSPHAAAAMEGKEIRLKGLLPPKYGRTLIIEGAGGILVPLNTQGETMADLANHFNAKIIVVSHHYLGSINHTLLTLEAIKQRNLPLAGIVFSGKELPQTEEIILEMTGVEKLGTIPHLDKINKESIAKAALRFEELSYVNN